MREIVNELVQGQRGAHHGSRSGHEVVLPDEDRSGDRQGDSRGGARACEGIIDVIL